MILHRLLISFLVSATCGVLVLGSPRGGIAATGQGNEDWTAVHGGLFNQRYLPLTQINPTTISKLGAIWISEPFADGVTSRMTPLVHDGLMFLGAASRIYALDARSGKIVWVRQMEMRKSSAGSVIRGDMAEQAAGVAAAATRSWGLALGGGMIFVGLMNGHLMALREKSGDLVWDQLISDEPLGVSKGITCTPLYVDGILYFGLGQDTTRGYAVAVDANSGRVLWRVSTVAEPGRPGHETWPQGSEIWRSGGAHPWAAPAADPILRSVYFVTGNAAPAYGGQIRPGDNLYSASLIALDMKTGKLRWYRQLVHHDVWESDLSIPPVLFDAAIGGHSRKAVAVMRGDGHLFLLDRISGEPLVPIDERAVPQNPAVFTAATQPFPRGGESILPPCESWRSKIPAGFVLGCMFDPPSQEVPNRLSQYASVRIAPMSYNPQTGYFYAQGRNSLMWLSSGEDPYTLITNVNGFRVPNFPQQTVVVAAVDSRSGKVVWKRELPTFDDSGYKSNGGALSTAGSLVFHQGGDGTLQAYDVKTGEILWQFQTDFAGGDASPMTYAVDGKQYVAFTAGSKVWAFALGGQLPKAAAIAPPTTEAVTGAIQDSNEIETLTLEQVPANGRRYRLDEFAFNPYRARVHAGTAVTFINNGYKPHTIVGQDGSWTTGTLAPTQVAAITFKKPGSYLYSSKEYPWSFGQIIVVPETANLRALTEAQQAASDQVNLGKEVYVASCSGCHGETLSGRDPAPALIGHGFNTHWVGRDALDLFDRIRTTMPTTAPGTLSDESYAAIVSYILYSGDNPAPVVLDRRSMKGLTVTTR